MFQWFKKFSMFDESLPPSIASDHTEPFDLTLANQTSQFRRMMKQASDYDNGLILFDDLKNNLQDIVDEPL